MLNLIQNSYKKMVLNDKILNIKINNKFQNILCHLQQKIYISITQENMNLLNKLLLIVLLSMLIISTYQHHHMSHQENYLATKNSKIYALKYTPTDNHQNDQSEYFNKIWIQNDQQSIRIQVPVLAAQVEQKYPIGNYSELFPIFYNNLKSKGYIKPLHPETYKKSDKIFVKGYKYLKPNQNYEKTDQTIVQIEHLLQNIVKENGLNFLSLRMEDSFSIEVVLNQQRTTHTINSIQVQYLFATVQKDAIPAQIFYKLSAKLYNYQEFQNKQKVGSIQRRLHGKGLHQWVNTTLHLQDEIDIELQSVKDKCYYQFTDILPESTYIDSDQRREQTINFETINVEKPAFASKQYFYIYRVSLKQFQENGVNKYLYQQPIHFRYPVPSELNITTVYLHPIESARIVCQGNGEQHKVYDLKENHLFDRGVAKIPNADSSMSKIVPVITLTVCLFAVLKIYTTLKKQ